jgi:hypothetical protein
LLLTKEGGEINALPKVIYTKLQSGLLLW